MTNSEREREAWTLWQEARERHEREPWVVNAATVALLKERWAETLR